MDNSIRLKQNIEAVRKVEHSNKNFNVKLYDHVAYNKKDNVVFSPFSIQSVLSMVLNGAGGETANQIRSGLSFPTDEFLHPGMNEILSSMRDKANNFTLKTANRLYIQNGYDLRKRFLGFNKRTYLSVPEIVDFQDEEKARQTINKWVSEETNEKIKDLIGPNMIKPLTKLVLVNALYFKGAWLDPFSKTFTRKEEFYTDNGQVVNVDMMHKQGKYNYAELKKLDAKRLVMPYAGKRLSMVLILPNEKDGLMKLEEKLRSVDLFELVNPSPRTEYSKNVSLSLPKFKIESTHDLKDPLKRIGVQHMFDRNRADFSGMSGANDLYVDFIIQKAFIEVNEEGSEAAAATALGMLPRSAPRNPESTPEFICDHPFLFMIKDHLTGVILFSGKITNPKI